MRCTEIIAVNCKNCFEICKYTVFKNSFVNMTTYIPNTSIYLFFILIPCTMYLLLFCTMSNKCKIISQIIILLHVSTLSCHPQGACNQYLAKLHKYFKCGSWYYNLQLRCFVKPTIIWELA
jgi:hypothetical protein